MTRIRSKSKTVYQVWYTYPDKTEEMVKEFKYPKPAEKLVEVLRNNKELSAGKFDIREFPIDVL